MQAQLLDTHELLPLDMPSIFGIGGCYFFCDLRHVSPRSFDM
jgi:hypothetical protein